MYPSVSVIIRGYNRERYISQAIESVLAQTYTDFDLLVWDDGSTDKTAQIAIKYAKKDRRVRVAACDHRGAVKSLKAGVADTFGAYLCWVDSDDFLSPSALEETVAVLDGNPSVGMVYTDYQLIDTIGRIKGHGRRCRIPYSKDRLLLDFMTFHFRLIRRSVFEQTGGIDADFRCAEDYDLCMRLSEVTEIRHIQKPLYQYRVHPRSISHEMRLEQVHWSREAIANALKRRGLADRFEVDLQIRERFSLKRREPDG
ncbi:MAG: filamentous hemagglutinin [Deltaproteobacteria bacterium]|nr:MAG: filamentous hemagglutinin [Deltaproteobacteria bacterium]